MSEGQSVVHLSGPVRPFAVCGSYNALERHTKHKADVTCDMCLRRVAAKEDDG